MSHCKLKIGCVIFITVKLPKVGPHSCLVPIRLKAGPLMMANSLRVNASGQDVADFASRKKKKDHLKRCTDQTESSFLLL